MTNEPTGQVFLTFTSSEVATEALEALQASDPSVGKSARYAFDKPLGGGGRDGGRGGGRG